MDCYNPVRLLTGRGCLAAYTGFAAFGSRAIVVTGHSAARRSGALADAEAALQAAGVAYTLFDEIEPNPMLDTVYRGGAAACAFGAEMVIGIGGGSALDGAKAVAAFAANPDFAPLDLYTKPRRPALPILAVNTTAGTGSEVTPTTVLTVPEYETKKSVSGEDLFARVAFCDPAYTASLPMSQTVSTAADALSHAVESVFSPKSTPFSEALAFQAIRMSAQGLRALRNGLPDEATRETLLYASTLAGYAIARTGTGFVHAAGYPLTYFHGVPHGAANAYFLPAFVECMSRTAPTLAARVLEACGVPDIGGLTALMHAYPDMKLDLRLSASRCADYAARVWPAKNIRNAVYVISQSELEEIFRQVFLR